MRIDPKGFGIDQSKISAIAICSLVAAVLTAALSYARARGEMLDEIETAGQTPNRARTLFINGPWFLFLLLSVVFVALFCFFVGTGFSNQVEPGAAAGVGPVSNISQ